MAQAKILIVDDEVVVAEDIRRQLRALGYLVVGVVASADEAVRLAGEHRPDLVLMDIKLKGPMDGIDAARIIQTQYGAHIRVALETTLGLAGEQDSARPHR